MCFPPSLYSQMHYFTDIVDTSIGFILCIDAIYSLIKFCNMELSFHSLHSHYKYDPLWPSIMAPSLPQGPSHIYHGPRLPQWSQPHLQWPLGFPDFKTCIICNGLILWYNDIIVLDIMWCDIFWVTIYFYHAWVLVYQDAYIIELYAQNLSAS